MLASTEYVALVGDDDKGGDTTAYVNPLSQTIYYVYDDAGRMTTVDYPSGTDTTLSYDNADRNTSMVDSTGTSSWTNDNADRTTQLVTPQGTLTYAYDNAGRRTSMADSTGTTSYSFDSTGRLSSLTNPHSETTSFTYDTLSRVTRRDLANGTYELIGYDSRSRATSITTKNSSGKALDARAYTFDAADNVTQAVEGGLTTTYTYDAIDQLLTEAKSGYSASYTYDANGNRATRTVNSATENYAYDDADKLTSVSVGGSTTKAYGYNSCGRTTSIVTSAGTTTFAYDYESRVTSLYKPGYGTETYSYNGLDTRVGSSGPGGSKTFRRDGVEVTDPVLSDAAATYTPGVSERRSGSSTYLHSGLKDANMQTDANQNLVADRCYDAFGNLIASNGTWRGPFGHAGPYGYQEDGIGFQLLGHRLYDPSTGRFLTRDPAKDSSNWFAYCENNPSVRVDPNGEVFFVIFMIGFFLAGSYEIAEAPGLEPRPFEPPSLWDRIKVGAAGGLLLLGAARGGPGLVRATAEIAKRVAKGRKAPPIRNKGERYRESMGAKPQAEIGRAAKSLGKQARKHIQKFSAEPENINAGHWQKELAGFLDSIDELQRLLP